MEWDGFQFTVLSSGLFCLLLCAHFVFFLFGVILYFVWTLPPNWFSIIHRKILGLDFCFLPFFLKIKGFLMWYFCSSCAFGFSSVSAVLTGSWWQSLRLAWVFQFLFLSFTLTFQIFLYRPPLYESFALKLYQTDAQNVPFGLFHLDLSSSPSPAPTLTSVRYSFLTRMSTGGNSQPINRGWLICPQKLANWSVSSIVAPKLSNCLFI